MVCAVTKQKIGYTIMWEFVGLETKTPIAVYKTPPEGDEGIRRRGKQLKNLEDEYTKFFCGGM